MKTLLRSIFAKKSYYRVCFKKEGYPDGRLAYRRSKHLYYALVLFLESLVIVFTLGRYSPSIGFTYWMLVLRENFAENKKEERTQKQKERSERKQGNQ